MAVSRGDAHNAYRHSIPACQLACGCIVRGEIESVTESGSLNGQDRTVVQTVRE